MTPSKADTMRTSLTIRAKPIQSKSQKAALAFPVGRILSKLRKSLVGMRIGVGAAVYLAATLEYLTAEVVAIAGEIALANGKKRLSPRHLLLALSGDNELNRLIDGNKTIIPEGGVLPKIEPALFRKKKKEISYKEEKIEQEQQEEKKPMKLEVKDDANDSYLQF